MVWTWKEPVAHWPLARELQKLRISVSPSTVDSRELKAEFWSDVNGARHRRRAEPDAGARRPGGGLHRARRAHVRRRPFHRNESCGGHFRAESQTPEGEALRDDEKFAYVRPGSGAETGKPVLHKEPLTTSTST